jgi:hypothetical protein
MREIRYRAAAFGRAYDIPPGPRGGPGVLGPWTPLRPGRRLPA